MRTFRNRRTHPEARKAEVLNADKLIRQPAETRERALKDEVSDNE